MNHFEFYDAGYEAGLEGNDRCPHLPFTFAWLWWHAGNAVGHHTLCSQIESIVYLFGQD